MADSVEFWWCLRHDRVETEENRCPAQHRLGPYPNEAEARRALQTVRDRNAAWDAADERWGD